MTAIALETMNIHAIYHFFMARFRPRRMRRLFSSIPEVMQPDTSVIDIGGTCDWWLMAGIRGQNILIVNLDDRLRSRVEAEGFKFDIADGRSLPYPNLAFDLAISNSVIEHVGSFKDQQAFVREMRRCSRAMYLQTPSRWFFVEPHIIGVFIHWLPLPIYRRLVRWLSVWGWVNKPNQHQIDQFLASTRLLDRCEMEELFPGLEIRSERFLGMTKSFEVVYRPLA